MSTSTKKAEASGSSPKTLTNHALFAAFVALLGIVAASALVYFLVLQPANDLTFKQANETAARAYVEVINSRVQMLYRQGAHLAALPQVRQALATPNPASQLTLQQNLAIAIPGVRAVFIHPKGAVALRANDVNPINFAAVVMARAAEAGNQPPPEAHQVGSGAPVIYAASPIKDANDAVAGTLLMLLDGRYLSDALAGVNHQAGRLSIEQRFDGSTVEVIALGDAGSNHPPLEFATQTPNWFLRYTPAQASAAASTISTTTLIPALVMLLVAVVGGIFLGFRRLQNDAEIDTIRLQGQAATLIGSHVPPTGYRLLVTNKIAEALANLDFLPGARSNTRAAEGGAVAASRVSTQPVEMEVDLQDESFLDIEKPKPAMPAAKKPDDEVSVVTVDPTIFRAYDIRGIVQENLGEDVVYLIGRALAAEASELNIKQFAVGGDGRLSSPKLRGAMVRGFIDSGIDVIDVGQVPTPLLYYATHEFGTGSGVMITGSHNPPEYNGLKMVLGGVTLAEDRIQWLRERIEKDAFVSGKGSQRAENVVDRYITRIADDVTVARSLKVVVDCGNGVAGAVAPALLRALGCDVIELYCDVDGTFPNHHPDPAVPENLKDLMTAVRHEKADIGLAFDGDGDRLGVITNSGKIVWPDRLMMLFARDIVGRNPGSDVIYDVKCSRHLGAIITEYGGRPIMWKTGHSHIKAKIKETGALLGGEFSGHIAFLERWYGFDDALYSAARLLEIVGSSTETVDEIFSEFPNPAGTPEIKIQTTETRKFEIMDALRSSATFENGSKNTIDGLRVDFANGWGLIRPSNTSPVLTLRFEADDSPTLEQIIGLFRRELKKIDPALTFEV